jgi:hypothetical protein
LVAISGDRQLVVTSLKRSPCPQCCPHVDCAMIISLASVGSEHSLQPPED